MVCLRAKPSPCSPSRRLRGDSYLKTSYYRSPVRPAFCCTSPDTQTRLACSGVKSFALWWSSRLFFGTGDGPRTHLGELFRECCNHHLRRFLLFCAWTSPTARRHGEDAPFLSSSSLRVLPKFGGETIRGQIPHQTFKRQVYVARRCDGASIFP